MGEECLFSSLISPFSFTISWLFYHSGPPQCKCFVTKMSSFMKQNVCGVQSLSRNISHRWNPFRVTVRLFKYLSIEKLYAFPPWFICILFSILFIFYFCQSGITFIIRSVTIPPCVRQYCNTEEVHTVPLSCCKMCCVLLLLVSLVSQLPQCIFIVSSVCF